MPRLQQAIQEALPKSEMLTNLTSDEVMAVGCSNQAALIGEPWDPECQHLKVSVGAISKDISVRVSIVQFIKIEKWVKCIWRLDIFLQCGDEEESETTVVFTAQTPLSSRFSLPVPLGKKHNIATVDVFEEAQLVAKV